MFRQTTSSDLGTGRAWNARDARAQGFSCKVRRYARRAFWLRASHATSAARVLLGTQVKQQGEDRGQVAGMTDHVWITAELLGYRVPAPLLDTLDAFQHLFPALDDEAHHVN